jgi:hypothetical protein
MRKCSGEVVTELAAKGMLYLDILAQGKGFLPVALCAWNIVATNGNIAPWASPSHEQKDETS